MHLHERPDLNPPKSHRKAHITSPQEAQLNVNLVQGLKLHIKRPEDLLIKIWTLSHS